MDSLSLTVSAKKYEGWQDVSVTRSIEQLADTFSVGYAEQWNEENEPLPIVAGDAVELEVDGQKIIDGFVDDESGSYDNASHDTSVTGRSRPGDLVDCAAIHKGGAWKKSSIKKIAEDVCRPCGISVSLDAPAGAPFNWFAVQEGETAHELLSRAAAMRALLVVSKPDGGISIVRVGTRKVSTVLEYGVNILRGSKTNSTRDRFSSYIGKAQIPGNDKTNGKDTILKRTVADSRIERYRPTIIQADAEDTGKELKDLVTWERNRRAGNARSVTYTVQGWHEDDGELWEPNTLAVGKDKFFRINGEELLIVSVTLNKSLAGTTASLTLKRPEAFDLIELPTRKAQGKGKDLYS